MSKLSSRIPPLSTQFIQQKIINLTKYLLALDESERDRDASFARNGNVVLTMHVHENNSINLNIREVEPLDNSEHNIDIDSKQQINQLNKQNNNNNIISNNNNNSNNIDKYSHSLRPIITVSNHIANLDDPIMWGNLGWDIGSKPQNMRWTLGASNILYTNDLYSYFFNLGKCVKTIRGNGIYQEAIDFAIDRLSEGQWVHWGVGRMVAESALSPLILPVYHRGLEQSMPLGKPPIPRIGKHLEFFVGQPFDCEDIIQAFKSDRRIDTTNKNAKSTSQSYSNSNNFILNNNNINDNIKIDLNSTSLLSLQIKYQIESNLTSFEKLIGDAQYQLERGSIFQSIELFSRSIEELTKNLKDDEVKHSIESNIKPLIRYYQTFKKWDHSNMLLDHFDYDVLSTIISHLIFSKQERDDSDVDRLDSLDFLMFARTTVLTTIESIKFNHIGVKCILTNVGGSFLYDIYKQSLASIDPMTIDENDTEAIKYIDLLQKFIIKNFLYNAIDNSEAQRQLSVSKLFLNESSIVEQENESIRLKLAGNEDLLYLLFNYISLINKGSTTDVDSKQFDNILALLKRNSGEALNGYSVFMIRYLVNRVLYNYNFEEFGNRLDKFSEIKQQLDNNWCEIETSRERLQSYSNFVKSVLNSDQPEETSLLIMDRFVSMFLEKVKGDPNELEHLKQIGIDLTRIIREMEDEHLNKRSSKQPEKMLIEAKRLYRNDEKEKSLELVNSIIINNDNHLNEVVMNLKANIMYDKRKFEEAISCARQSIELYDKQGKDKNEESPANELPWVFIDNNIIIAKCLTHFRKYREAEQLFSNYFYRNDYYHQKDDIQCYSETLDYLIKQNNSNNTNNNINSIFKDKNERLKSELKFYSN
ncbi:tafazzin isoform 8 -like protein [Heterostelium album PN500]|uniref:Tafazzin isoform 8-like protein n=1 Tax=Heterostelium pallidum (strain ATCC 26659 / Pp 5 / PN500) TaxID=670386 RepID=D3BH06_HETP5|nr:tafazzin isoform 8 -like protein [Heterostelium album PN500]EFA79390.1 tafazzin isoform 8 -like protein [Heterostelium album PN500]|eukprot:XP_020431511.1 tafazzin isoform 8 -like protein [Heterostelium album PN500]